MIAEIRPSKISGTVMAPPSKSHAIRVALYSMIADVHAESFPASEDVTAALQAVGNLGCKTVGGKIQCPGHRIRHQATLNFMGSGTTLRMMMPLLAYVGGEFVLDGDETLRKRPIRETVRILSSMGMAISGDHLPLRMSGKVSGNDIEVPGWESSQTVSGFIYALLLEGGGRIHIIPPVVSRHYIEMTCEILNSLGARIRLSGDTIYVERSEMRPFKGQIPGDYLLSSFYAAAAFATSGSVRIGNLPKPPQAFGDHSIVYILREAGIDSTYSEGSWKVSHSRGKAIEQDISQSPDMAVSLAAFAPFLEGTTVISGIENLRNKESDRVSTISEVVRSFGAEVECGDKISISGPLSLNDPVVNSHRDHRIAMLASVFALSRGGSVTDAECVHKSNPGFYSDLRNLGGDILLDH